MQDGVTLFASGRRYFFGGPLALKAAWQEVCHRRLQLEAIVPGDVRSVTNAAMQASIDKAIISVETAS